MRLFLFIVYLVLNLTGCSNKVELQNEPQFIHKHFSKITAPIQLEYNVIDSEASTGTKEVQLAFTSRPNQALEITIISPQSDTLELLADTHYSQETDNDGNLKLAVPIMLYNSRAAMLVIQTRLVNTDQSHLARNFTLSFNEDAKPVSKTAGSTSHKAILPLVRQ